MTEPRTPQGLDLDLALYRAASFLMVIAVAEGCGRTAVVSAAIGSLPLSWIVLAVAGVGAIVGVVESILGSPGRLGVRLYCAASLAALGLSIVLPDERYDVEYRPLWSLVMTAWCLTSVAVSPRAVAWVSPVVVVEVVIERTPAVGGWQAAYEASLFVLTALLCAAGVRALHRAATWVRTASESSWSAHEGLVRDSARAQAKRRWDGLVHDKVLGALRLAGRPDGRVDEAARTLAGQAAQALRTLDPLAARPFRTSLHEHARGLGLDLDLDVTGECLDESVGAAFLGATAEALTNIHRHAPGRGARIHGHLGAAECRITICEVESGRTAKTLTPTSLALPPPPIGAAATGVGLQVSVVERMADVGGSAVVHPDERGALVVELQWCPADPAEDAPVTWWRERDFHIILWLGLGCLITHVLIGLTFLDVVRSREWQLAGILVFGLLVAVDVRAATDGWTWRAAVIGLVLLPAAFLLNLDDAPVSDWRYWFVGVMDLPFAVMSFRSRPWAGVAAAVGQLAAMLAASAARGNPRLWAVTGGWGVVVASALLGMMMRLAMDRTTASVNSTAAETGATRLEAVRAQEREAESRRRLGRLEDSVLPMLDHIASGAPLTDEDRAECRLLEAEARDQLVAAPLLAPPLVTAIAQARARGATVVLAAQGETPPELVAPFREVCRAVLSAAQADSRLVALWRPNNRGRLGSVSLVGTSHEVSAASSDSAAMSESQAPGLSLVERIRRAAATPGVRVVVTSDVDTALVEIDRTGPTTPADRPAPPTGRGRVTGLTRVLDSVRVR